MIRNLFKGSAKTAAASVREKYNAEWFDGRILIEKPDTDFSLLLNMLVQGEVARLDANERLDGLIALQKEQLAIQKKLLSTQQSILDKLKYGG
ncbi:hypothetical protein OSJ77_16395 [Phyllobacterium sp. 0TCS1.6C]|uniref:hypothetical protein n=1 Tax=unclassified Phyllobacterium TaxID=2638441 RepID=UPI00226563F7|nr:MULTISPECIES: hypothetical protein [unclassified Phyllobacterium]MCX8281775.1 hypothetical protein [Phyllobacterium sp. 0TCS1.6C]MCX8295310.1 hypothetical protein [Phyllobacterium sp. 0TCS1.6A]